MYRIAAVASLMLVAACGQSGSGNAADAAADRLDAAAEQSDPAAAPALENAADALREDGQAATLNAAGSPAQEALAAGGAAQAGSATAGNAVDPVLSPQRTVDGEDATVPARRQDR